VKLLDKLIIKSFIGPFIMTFFIALFVLVMQFLWKYVDDMIGKGLEWYTIGELLIYTSASLVPMALPLAILLSSLMTLGDFGESYELVSCKSAGLSLQRIMMPLVICVIIISMGAFYFANNIIPIANLKFASLLFDIRQKKPAFNIREGVFYNAIDNYSIKVGKKEKDGKTLHNIMIYDHSRRRGNDKVLVAKSGIMKMSDDERFLILELHDGKQYEEMIDKNKKNKVFPYMRMNFSKYELKFDLTSFDMNRTDEALFKNNYQMLNISQLTSAIDTLTMKLNRRKGRINNNIGQYSHFNNDSAKSKITPRSIGFSETDFIQNFPHALRHKLILKAKQNVRNVKGIASRASKEIEEKERFIKKHKIERHRKFTLSVACFVLFFIGAPLGAIIRVGGLGMPVVISVLFFVMYYVISITGEKFAKEGLILAYQGMWAPIFIIMPLGIYITRKATADSVLFDINMYIVRFKKMFLPFMKRNS